MLRSGMDPELVARAVKEHQRQGDGSFFSSIKRRIRGGRCGKNSDHVFVTADSELSHTLLKYGAPKVPIFAGDGSSLLAAHLSKTDDSFFLPSSRFKRLRRQNHQPVSRSSLRPTLLGTRPDSFQASKST